MLNKSQDASSSAKHEQSRACCAEKDLAPRYGCGWRRGLACRYGIGECFLRVGRLGLWDGGDSCGNGREGGVGGLKWLPGSCDLVGRARDGLLETGNQRVRGGWTLRWVFGESLE